VSVHPLLCAGDLNPISLSTATSDASIECPAGSRSWCEEARDLLSVAHKPPSQINSDAIETPGATTVKGKMNGQSAPRYGM
jgi:hypothetical protein